MAFTFVSTILAVLALQGCLVHGRTLAQGPTANTTHDHDHSQDHNHDHAHNHAQPPPAAAALAAATSAQTAAPTAAPNAAPPANASTAETVFGRRQFVITLSNNLSDHRGVWFGLGDQYTQNVWESFDVKNERLPVCSSHVGEYNWAHFAEDDPHFLTIAGNSGTFDYISAGHQTSGVSRVLNFTNSVIEYVNLATGVRGCKHWQPYVDLATGTLHVYSVGMYLWTADAANASVPVNYTSIACEAAGDEVVGCYTGDVQRTSDVPASIKEVSAQRQGAGTFANRPAGSVISVSTSTYVCRNGQCLALAPKFAEEEGAH